MQYSFLQAALLGSAVFLPFAAAAGSPPPTGTQVGSQVASAPSGQPTPECTKVALTNVMAPKENNPCPPGQAPKEEESQPGQHEQPSQHEKPGQHGQLGQHGQPGQHGQHGHHGQHGQHNGEHGKEHEPSAGGYNPQQPPKAKPSAPPQPGQTTTTTQTGQSSDPTPPTVQQGQNPPPQDPQNPNPEEESTPEQTQATKRSAPAENLSIQTVPNPTGTPAPKPSFHCKQLGGPQRPQPLAERGTDEQQQGEAEAIVLPPGEQGTEKKCPPGYISLFHFRGSRWHSR